MLGQGAWVVLTGRCGCLRWVERWFWWCKLQLLVEPLGFLSLAGAVKTLVFFCRLAWVVFSPYGIENMKIMFLIS